MKMQDDLKGLSTEKCLFSKKAQSSVLISNLQLFFQYFVPLLSYKRFKSDFTDQIGMTFHENNCRFEIRALD